MEREWGKEGKEKKRFNNKIRIFFTTVASNIHGGGWGFLMPTHRNIPLPPPLMRGTCSPQMLLLFIPWFISPLPSKRFSERPFFSDSIFFWMPLLLMLYGALSLRTDFFFCFSYPFLLPTHTHTIQTESYSTLRACAGACVKITNLFKADRIPSEDIGCFFGDGWG